MRVPVAQEKVAHDDCELRDCGHDLKSAIFGLDFCLFIDLYPVVLVTASSVLVLESERHHQSSDKTIAYPKMYFQKENQINWEFLSAIRDFYFIRNILNQFHVSKIFRNSQKYMTIPYFCARRSIWIVSRGCFYYLIIFLVKIVVIKRKLFWFESIFLLKNPIVVETLISSGSIRIFIKT